MHAHVPCTAGSPRAGHRAGPGAGRLLGRARPRTADGRQDCITDFDPHTDYFPDKSTLSDAANFAIEYHRSYQILTVHRPYLGGKPVSYVLVRCGAPAPALSGELAAAQRITVPVRRLYSGSTTHLAMITELGEADVVTGVASPAAVADPQIRERIDAGETVGYAPGGQVNIESVLHAAPTCWSPRAWTTPATPSCGRPACRWSPTPNGWSPPAGPRRVDQDVRRADRRRTPGRAGLSGHP